jgi:hypothetical protein
VRPQYFRPERFRSSQNFRLFAGLIILLLASSNAFPQIQQAWVARYNNGITNGTNQAVKMALDSNGDVYVLGVSQNTNNQLGYVTIKYAPNGTQLWAARYDSTNYTTATPSGFVLDSSNNVIVTGNTLTVKYDTNGHQLWTAPYNGSSIGVDSSGNCIVTGFGSGFNTIKLSPNGSNLWSKSFITEYGPAQSEAMVVDPDGNAYVAGWDTYVCYSNGDGVEDCYPGLITLKYDPNGNQLWQNTVEQTGFNGQLVAGMALDNARNLYLVANISGPGGGFQTFCYSSNGSFKWMASPDNGIGPANGLALDGNSNVIVAGQNPYAFNAADNYIYYYTTYQLNSGGTPICTNNYPQPPTGSSAATSVAVDLGGNAYITGYSSGITGTNNIVTIKYGPTGNQLWLQSYNGLNAGNDAGNAIAVDRNGHVYVTGYETLPGGGTGIVTIKYIPISIQRQTNGTVLIETQGTPGQSFDIQASSDLLNWLDLGTILADTNGLMQFDDTNAPNFPARFYYTNPK